MITADEINKFIKNDLVSKRKKKARTGQDYYDARHDILSCRFFYFNSDGKLVEDFQRSNTKIPHPYFTELVDQATQYLLSGKEPVISSDDPVLAEYLQEYFDDDFKSELMELVSGVQIKGFDYMYAYKNKEDRISFQYADGMGVVEAEGKDTSDGKDYYIYWNQETRASDNKSVKKIRVFDEGFIYYYRQVENGAVEQDPDEAINPRPNVVYEKEGEEGKYYENLGYIPFFRMINNKKQTSSLRPIKLIIDDYDIMSCGLTNNITDFDNPLYIIKGFEGNNLDELQQNLKTKKMIGVGEGGGVDVYTVSIPYEARKTQMEMDEKNIYRFGMGFNAAQVGDGNITNVVILARYSLLDLKCNKLEMQLRKFLKSIVEIVLDEINKKYDKAFTLKDVRFNFTRVMITNAKDNAEIEKIKKETEQIQINILLGLFNTLDDESIIRKICEALDIDYDEIKNRLPAREDTSTEDAIKKLNAMDDEGNEDA